MSVLESPAQNAFREEVRTFVDETVAPVAADLERNRAYPHDILEKLADEGLVGLPLPEAVGGLGKGHVELAILSEELSTAMAALPSILSPHWNVATIIDRFGTEHQRETHLRSMASFETVGGFALTEKKAGSDIHNIQTTAERDGEEWVIDGSKRWVGNLPQADFILTYARTGSPTSDHAGISAFVVPADEFETDGHWEKFGTRSVETCRATLTDVSVPTENLVGSKHRALKERSTVSTGINVPARAVGLARASLEATASYVMEREQFDRQIGDFQGVRWKIAEMAERVAAARALTLQAAHAIDRGEAADPLFSIAKVTASEAAVANANVAMRLHGGIGYTTECDVERFLREARQLTISGGSNEGHRDTIASSVLEEPGST